MQQRLTLLLPLILFLLFAGVAFWGLWSVSTGARDTKSIGFSREGQAMPSITLPLLGAENQQLSLEDWQGRAYAINVWASWCLPCRAEAPAIARLAESIPVLGINTRDQYDDARGFLAQFGNPYTAHGVDANGRASIEIGVQALPETLIIAPDGTIILHHRGPIFAREMDGVIADALKKLGRE